MDLNKHQLSRWSAIGLMSVIATTIATTWVLSNHSISTYHSVNSGTFRQLSLPLLFEKNEGQTAGEVAYLSRVNGYTLFFTQKEIVMDLRSSADNDKGHGKIQQIKANLIPSNDVLRLQFINANANPHIIGDDKTSSKSNYLIGNDPTKWHRNIANFAKVNYQNLYPGIDMVFYGNQNRLEYDIRVAPGTDPQQARFHIDGAKSIYLNKQGDLILKTHENKEILMHKPIIYQMVNGTKQAVTGDFSVAANQEFGFKVGPYDKRKLLVIDPVLSMCSFLGGSGGDNAVFAMTLSQDPLPNVFMTGYTNSTDFPTVGPYQASNKGKGRTAFVTKYDRASNTILYSTYLGGSGGNDEGFAIAVDAVSSAYVTGETNSKDFPLKNAFQSTNKGAKYFSAFVTKLNPEGNDISYSTYLGGTGDNQEGNAIAVDSQGFAYITGETDSYDFPVLNAFQSTNHAKPRPAPLSPFTAFVTKLNTVGNGLVFSTYLGGSGGQDEGNGIAIDTSNNIYITGETNSKDFPVVNPLQAKPKPAGEAQTGFVTKMASTGQVLVFSTYLGGSGGNDYPTAIKIDDLRAVYIGGYTNSADFPMVVPIQATNHSSNFNGFLAKINPLGTAIVYSTYVGGSGGNDRILAIDVDVERKLHFVGFTNSKDFPLANALQTVNKGPDITGIGGHLTAAGDAFLIATYFGGSGGNDKVTTLVLDQLTNVYFGGLTNSIDMPIINAIQPVKTSNITGFFGNLTF